MNMLKSLFVSAYMMAAMVIIVFAVKSLLDGVNAITWRGVILVYAPLMLVISWLMLLGNISRTSSRFPILIVLGTLGVIASVWGYGQDGSLVAPALVVSGLLIGGFSVFVLLSPN